MKIIGIKNNNSEWNDRGYASNTYYSSKRFMKRYWRKKSIRTYLRQSKKDNVSFIEELNDNFYHVWPEKF